MSDAETNHSPTPPSPDSHGGADEDHEKDALDPFSITIYALVAIAMLGQAVWILWVEYIV